MPDKIHTLKLQEVRDAGFRCYCFFGQTPKDGAIGANQIAKMVDMAREVQEFSYSPYSKFTVGAAVLASNGKTDQIFVGTNIENAAYGPTICAERVAMSTAIAAGFTKIKAVAVVGDSPPGNITGPCGTCRQVIYEHGGSDCVVFMIDSNDLITVVNAGILLPFAFGPSNLKST